MRRRRREQWVGRECSASHSRAPPAGCPGGSKQDWWRPLFGSSCTHFGPCRTIFGPFRSVSVHFGSYKDPSRSHFGPIPVRIRPMSVHVGACGVHRPCLFVPSPSTSVQFSPCSDDAVLARQTRTVGLLAAPWVRCARRRRARSHRHASKRASAMLTRCGSWTPEPSSHRVTYQPPLQHHFGTDRFLLSVAMYNPCGLPAVVLTISL